jgi:hypothetical protein
LVGPLFLYVGIETTTIPKIMFPILLGLGAFLIAYHAYLAYKKTMDGKSAWVNYIHIFAVAPLLIILGYNRKTTSRKYYEMLLILGFAGGGYHALSIMRDMLSR